MTSRKKSLSRGPSLVLCLAVYLAAAAVALAVGLSLKGNHPLAVAFAADSAATIVVFILSFALANSSLYDPYWSVAPPLLALYYGRETLLAGVAGSWQGALLGCVLLWALRLTWNWLRNWKGLGHEDWRYIRIADKTGRLYWPVSFLGIHYFPTLQVFFGCLALYPALALPGTFSTPLAALACAVTLGAIGIEARADRQLLDFVRSGPARGSIMATGLWKWSRHPNYFGEVAFWWGIFLFGAASGNFFWWTLAGPVFMTAMFMFISIPMMDRRMVESRPGYAGPMKKT
jgi:steroid 5-alpha reductase family enzyme